ncbi:MAG: DMT family transporter [Promethearchaeota archaeon]
MVIKQKHNQDHISTDINSQNFYPNRSIGIKLSFVTLILLGILPIISNSRPSTLNAFNFAFYLSFWELIFSLPLFFYELPQSRRGLFQKAIDPQIKRKTLTIMGITGIIFSIATFFYIFAFEKAGTVNAAIAIQTYPLFSILIEFVLFKKKKRLSEIIFTLILMVGIYYLGTEGSWLISGFSPWLALTLTVPILWSIAHVIIKHTLDNSPITPNQVTFFRVLISSIVLFGVSSLVSGINNVFDGLTNIEFQIFGFLMGLVYYLELINWFYAVKHVDVSVASSIETPNPVITMILAFFILNESIEIYQIVAMIIVFSSLYGLIWSGRVKNHDKTRKLIKYNNPKKN